jgi:DNA invertase Pin-like site-specific DNA recombinase
MKSYYAYIRVSTVRQEKGCSLQEQRAAIEAYAARHGLNIIEWFEEQQTAAKRGRAVFSRMLKQIRAGRAQGVLIHKVDRSARNLRDWADVNDLIDAGVDVLLVHENLDLRTRGGRLSADIQAVVAADFIRNLREEIRKGIRGRLKQGLYPLPAPLGYVNNGKGNPKTPDPVTAPLVRQAFELYASGRYNLRTLGDELYRLGLRTRSGKRIPKNSLSVMLNLEFYIGIIFIRRTGERYQGVHEPLIAKSLFDRVQSLLNGKAHNRGWKHRFLYRRTVLCKHCGRVLIGERQKGYVYYRCHTRTCPRPAFREEVFNDEVERAVLGFTWTPHLLAALNEHIARHERNAAIDRKEAEEAITLALGKLDERTNRLTDALLDELIDKETFQERKRALLYERATLLERRERLNATTGWLNCQKAKEKLELVQSLSLRGAPTNPEEKLNLLRSASSNLTAEGKYVAVDWEWPFCALAAREEFQFGALRRDDTRTTREDAKVENYSALEWINDWCEALCRGMPLSAGIVTSTFHRGQIE